LSFYRKQVKKLGQFFGLSFFWGFFQWFYTATDSCGFQKFPSLGLQAFNNRYILHTPRPPPHQISIIRLLNLMLRPYIQSSSLSTFSLIELLFARFYFDFSPTYVGVAMICPHFVNVSVLLGAFLSWGIMWPLIAKKRGDWFSAELADGNLHGMQGYRVRRRTFLKGFVIFSATNSNWYYRSSLPLL
jgi:hypothetical protein